MSTSLNFSLDSVLVQDRKSSGYTAFFKQFPEVIAEGNSEQEALTNLVNTLHDALDYKAKNHEEISIPGFNVIEKSIDFNVNGNVAFA
jgi:predicted RNase H-like HicB family nuclease